MEILGERVVAVTGEAFTEKFSYGARATLHLAQKFGCSQAILK